MTVTFCCLSASAWAQSPAFTSTPVETGTFDALYTYNITTSGQIAVNREILLTAGVLPGGITLTDNGDGTAVMEGTPTETGSFPVELTVREVLFPSNNDVQAFTLTIDKATATVTLGTTSVVYSGSGQSATATTDPAGLDLIFTYDGSTTLPVGVGTYALEVTIDNANYEGSASGTFEITQAAATITFNSLTTVFDGDPQSVPVTTDPLGVSVSLTYNGSTTVPVNAGSYDVIATVSDPNYTGSASGVFVIQKATATVTLGTTSVVYTDSPQSATATTDPAGLDLIFTYDGSSTLPVEVGTYALEVTVDNENYEGSASGTFEITQAAATITFNSLTTVFDGDPQSVPVTTDPLGVSVSLTYNGSTTVPVNAGSYDVIATVSDPNYTGSASGVFVIQKATATVTLGTTSVVYTDSPQSATATTDPAGLDLIFTYDGSSTLPVEVGTYALEVTVDNENYEGSASGTFEITKAVATITFNSLTTVFDGNPKSASVTTDPAGVSVSLTYNGSATAPINAGSYDVIATVSNPNYTGSASDVFVIQKGTATITFGSLAFVYDGFAKNATATTTPSGLAVTYTYDGSVSAPVNAGSYAVQATVNTTNYTGSANGTLTISKATAVVTISNLNQNYDGNPKPVTVTTVPEGRTTIVTYNGSSTPPSAAGSYAVQATVNETNYTGSASNTLKINGPPTTSGIPDVPVNEDAANYFINLRNSFNDAEDGSLLIYTLEANTNPSLFTDVFITSSGTVRRLTIDFAPNKYGDADITIRATDSGGLWVEDQFHVSVASVQDMPKIVSVPVKGVLQGDNYVYEVTATDADEADILTYIEVFKPAWLTFTDKGDGKGTLTGVPAVGDIGKHFVSLKVSDDKGNTDTQVFEVEVKVSNEKPVFTSTPVTGVAEDATYSYTVVSTDPDNDNRTITAPTLPAWLNLIDNGNGTATLQGTPDNDQVGSHAVSLKVTDIFGAFSEQPFSITVTNTNDTPEFTSTPVTDVNQNGTYTYTVTTTDVDEGDVLELSATLKPSWLNLADNGDGTAVLSGNPPADLPDDFKYDVELMVTDAEGASATQPFSIVVIPNHAPQIVSITITINEDQTRSIGVSDFNQGYYDEDGDAISKVRIESVPGFVEDFSWKGQPLSAGDTVDVVNGSIAQLVYKAPEHQSGQTNFEWRAFDGFSWSAETAKLNIEVVPVNDKPLLTPTIMDTLYYAQGDPARSIVADTLIIDDVDNINMERATVAFTDGYIQGEDELIYTNNSTSNISAEFDVSTGELVLTGTDSKLNYATALGKVFYRNKVLGLTEVLNKSIDIVVSDGVDNSNVVKREIRISEVLPEVVIFNAFTPNEDGANDTWYFDNLGFYSVIKISVFDERGLEVFTCTTNDCHWDGTFNGKPLAAGPYFYTIDLNRGKRKYHGTVTILK